MGSPPPFGSKKVVLRFRSVSSMVIAPARTGKDRRRRIVVIRADQIKRVDFAVVFFLGRIFLMVAMKFTDPRIDLTPAK